MKRGKFGDTMPEDPHSKPVKEVLSELNVTVSDGLSPEEVTARRAIFGVNQLRARRPKAVFQIVLNQFQSPVVWLLGIAALVAFAFGEWKEGVAVAIVLAINAAIGFIAEYRAVRSMEALRTFGSVTTRVTRDGRAMLLPAEQLVPGDVVILEGGDIVTADLRLVAASNLSADESTLTGESMAISKATTPVPSKSALGDRSSMAFKGTSITRGGGLGVVVATGMHSELGRISKLVEEAVPERTPLERHLQKLSGQLIWFTILIVTLISLVGIYAGRDVFLMIQSSIALAVAAIPEGLPIVATMALARGMWRMAKQNALIDRLSAIETLGATTVIFTDKTGTLTENRMHLHEIYLPDRRVEVNEQKAGFKHDGQSVLVQDIPQFDEILTALVLCNNAELGTANERDTGDPLEIALLKVGFLNGKKQRELLLQYPRIDEVAFDSESKMMATLHQSDNDYLVCVKGAPEIVVEHATHTFKSDALVELSDEERLTWLSRTNDMAARGMRVLAIATKNTTDKKEPVYSKLVFLGLLGLHDPPRSDVRGAIAKCHRAGIRIIMITGDHAVTARNIAASLGLADTDSTVIEGHQLEPLENMSGKELDQIRAADIFARVSPTQKLDLVSIYQMDGEIVAMTGDGVNDAPALKKADIGIAMGLRGTQVAREAAPMVLRDDAFKTIVDAIREGRVIFRNIQRFVIYLLSCNLSEVLVVGTAILLGLPLPLLPLQILFLNLVTDIFPAFALGLGEDDRHVLKSPPRDPNKPIITRTMWMEMVAHSISITLSTLIALVLARHVLMLGLEESITVSFLTLAFAQLWHVFNMRDPRSGWFVNAITKNKFVWAAIAFSSALLLAAVYESFLAEILQLRPPTPQSWAIIIGASLLPLILGQIGKSVAALIYNRRKNSR